jgi:thiol:disulfide interchange protein DsbC
MSMKTKVIFGTVGLAGALLASAVCSAASDTQDIATIKKTLSASYPEVQVTDVKPSQIPGMYEVLSTDAVVYVDRTANYLIAGPLIATHTKADLSQEALDTRDAIAFDRLPLDKAIKTVRGDGSRVLAVFADPDCPYCHNLEKELAGLSDVTIYTFLYPLTSLHPDSRNKSHAIWCAPDRSAAWHDWMILDQAAPAPAADCTQDPLDDLQALGTSLKIASTPLVVLENGHRIRGTRPSAELNARLVSAHAERVRAASARSTTTPSS